LATLPLKTVTPKSSDHGLIVFTDQEPFNNLLPSSGQALMASHPFSSGLFIRKTALPRGS